MRWSAVLAHNAQCRLLTIEISEGAGVKSISRLTAGQEIGTQGLVE